MKSPLRIGTRDSKLALWQAHQVKEELALKGSDCEVIAVKSPGDLDLTTPLHLFGTTGIFTKVLDDALNADKIDIAVHSLKDYPTQAPEGLAIVAVLERGPHQDILVHKGDLSFLENKTAATIATGSIRRIAQWKSRYRHHETTNLRGNVQTRLKKLKESNWQGAIFARAGLQRVELLPENHIDLDWMIPAPAQGVIGIGCRQKDKDIIELLNSINHQNTQITSSVERQFLRAVEGGCSAPVGALTIINGNDISLKAGIFELDGSNKVLIDKTIALSRYSELGQLAAVEALENGGRVIMQKLRNV